MNAEEAKALLQRYRMGLCTDAEREAIEKWFDFLVSQGEVNWSEEEKMHFGDSLRKSVVVAIKQDSRVALVIKTHFVTFLRYAAAAVLILTLGTAGYFLILQKAKQMPLSAALQTPANDIAPGRDGAILTLADGREILLDSAGNGNVAVEGATVITHSNGQIQYETGDTKAKENLYNTMTTPKGRQYALVLSDGTRVWLNAGSSIRYPIHFKADARTVTITGEAYLEVAHLLGAVSGGVVQNVPFSVIANGMEVRVLGTRFNVNAYEDEAAIKTTLLEGSVQVIKNGKSSLLAPGQQAVVDQSGAIKVRSNANMEEALAWKNGLFTFDNADIQTVMRQLSRWYDMEVYFEGEMPKETFWGDLQKNANLSSVLKVLEKSGVKFTIEGKKVTVLQVVPQPSK